MPGFMHGFAKGERENTAEDELTAFKQAAREYLALSDQQIDQLIAIEALKRMLSV
jgi:hypothetical protein